ncbi:MAG: peptide chain release factor N(5)-glutamine methyltransferase [Pseudomonadota bacterium]
MTDLTVGVALAEAVAGLAASGVEDPARDARRLLSHRIGPGRLLDRDAWLTAREAEGFRADVAARMRRQPVSQILGAREFWGRRFEVTPDVLDPRPDTETLIDCALNGPAPERVLDLGTGSGAILLTLLAEWPGASGVGTDLSTGALEVAGRNADAFGLRGRVTFLLSDWLEGVAGRFDLVVSNPPYIAEAEMAGLAPEVREWEPWMALTPGGDGLAAYRTIAARLASVLRPGGRALFEIGADQGQSVPEIFRAAGFASVSLHHDLNKKPRVVEVFH